MHNDVSIQTNNLSVSKILELHSFDLEYTHKDSYNIFSISFK